MKWILLGIVLLLLPVVSAYTPPTPTYSATLNNLQINASDVTCNGFYCDIYNFSITNFGATTKWDIPFYTKLGGVEFYEWKLQDTNRINTTQSGTMIVEHNHNGTLENHTTPIYLVETVQEYSWKPSKQFFNSPHSKYGNKANATSSMNIGGFSTKYFWARFRNVFYASAHEYDIDFLHPFITSTEYKAGNDGANSFVNDINTTVNDTNLTIEAGRISIGVVLSNIIRPIVNETFENASIMQYNQSFGGSSASCALFSGGGNGINGTYALNVEGAGGAQGDTGCGRINTTYSPNRNPVNLTFLINMTESNGPSFLFGLRETNASAPPVIGILVRQIGGTDSCDGVLQRICINNISTGLNISYFAQKTRVLMQYIRNTTNGERTDILVTVNGTEGTVVGFPIDIAALTHLYFRVTAVGANSDNDMYIDNIEIYNKSEIITGANITTAGNFRTNQFTAGDYIRRFKYNSSETGTADGLLLNFTCDGGNNWQQGNSVTNNSRPPEDTILSCRSGGGTRFGYEGNVSEQQDLIAANISLVFNEDPKIHLAFPNNGSTNKSNVVVLNGSTFGDGDGDEQDINIYVSASQSTLNTTIAKTISNNANNTGWNYTASFNDGQTVFWKITVDDSWNDNVTINSSTNNFTIDTVTYFNASRYYQRAPNYKLGKASAVDINLSYYTCFNHTGDIVEWNQSLLANKTLITNASSISVVNTTNGNTAPASFAGQTVNFSTHNLSVGINPYAINFTLVNAVKTTTIREIDDTGNRVMRVEMEINNNVSVIKISDVDVFIDAVDMTHWSTRVVPLTSVSLSLLSGSGGGEFQNVSLGSDCVSTELVSVTDDTTGNFTLSATQYTDDVTGITINNLDLGGSTYLLRIVYSYQSDITQQSSVGGGGGGGSDLPIVFKKDGVAFSVANIRGTSIFDYIISPGDVRVDDIVISNTGTEEDVLTIECVNIGKDVCSWVTLGQTQVKITPSLKKENIPFKVSVPEETPVDDYFFNLHFTSKKGFDSLLKVKITVSSLGIFTGLINKLGQKVLFDSLVEEGTEWFIPVWLIFLITFITSLLGAGAIFKYAFNFGNGSVLVSFILALVVSGVTIAII